MTPFVLLRRSALKPGFRGNPCSFIACLEPMAAPSKTVARRPLLPIVQAPSGLRLNGTTRLRLSMPRARR